MCSFSQIFELISDDFAFDLSHENHETEMSANIFGLADLGLNIFASICCHH
jgi:hypothetical protein